MTQEQLSKANEINKSLLDLQNLKNYTEKQLSLNGNTLGEKVKVLISPQYGSDMWLRKEFLPMKLDDIMIIYITNIEKEIKKLEKELEEL